MISQTITLTEANIWLVFANIDYGAHFNGNYLEYNAFKQTRVSPENYFAIHRSFTFKGVCFSEAHRRLTQTHKSPALVSQQLGTADVYDHTASGSFKNTPCFTTCIR